MTSMTTIIMRDEKHTVCQWERKPWQTKRERRNLKNVLSFVLNAHIVAAVAVMEVVARVDCRRTFMVIKTEKLIYVCCRPFVKKIERQRTLLCVAWHGDGDGGILKLAKDEFHTVE